MKLTPKQESYCQGRFNGLSQRQAYLKAYPSSKKWKDRTVDNKASKLENTNDVLARLTELRENVASDNIMTAIELQEFWTNVVKQQNEVDVEMKDRLKASELLGKNKKMFTDKVEHSGEVATTINIIPASKRNDKK